MHVCMLPPCTMCCCAVRHRGLRALAVRMCREGRWRGVAGRGHATFVTTRPGVCPLAQASATARLYWPLTRHTGTALQRDAPSSRTCAHLAPHSYHCSQHLAVKTLTLRFAKASLSNRPLFECLRKKLSQIVAISSTCPAFWAPCRRTGLLTCSVADATVGFREPLSGPLFLTTHLAYFTTYIVMFLPAAVLPKGCTGLVVRS